MSEGSKRAKIAKLVVIYLRDKHGERIQGSLFLQYLKEAIVKALGKRVSWRTVSRYLESMEEQGLIRDEDGFTILKPQEMSISEILAVKAVYERLFKTGRE